MELRDIARLRLRNQRLAGASAEPAEAVVGWFGAMQAQEFPVAKWSIGQRSAGLDDTAVQRAFDEGRILRLHALRPTWHFVAATDLRWIQALTAPRVRGTNQYYDRQHGIDARVVEQAFTLVTEALRGGNYRTRAELGALLTDVGLPGAGGALAYVVMRAELDGIVASGPVRGKQHTYALVDERAPRQTELYGDEALAELTRRYFTSHGPATVTDFAWWSSLTVAQIRQGIALLGDGMSSVEVDGLRYWYTESRVDGSGPAAHALQAYDEFTNAYRDSRVVFSVDGRPGSPSEDRSTVHPVIHDGRFVALWQREVGRRGEIIARLKPLCPLSAGERRDIDDAFARYAAFAGVPVTVASG